MTQPHGDHEEQQGENHTRALLRVFDTQAPADFQEQVMARAYAQLQHQELQQPRPDGSEQEVYTAARSPRLGFASAVLAASLLLVGTTFYAAIGRSSSRSARQAPEAPSHTTPTPESQLSAASPAPAFSPGLATGAVVPPALTLLAEPRGADLPPVLAGSAPPSGAATLALSEPPPATAPSPRRPKRGQRQQAQEPRRPS